MKGYLTLDELAAFLGVTSTGSLRSQIRRGALKAERVGQRTWLVSEEEAAKYKEAHRAGEGKPGRRSKADPDHE
jgi:excisionase family DNA binding protein